MKQCKCEHWQECPVCQPSRFDADGNRLPPEPTPLQAAWAQIEKDTALLRQALEALAYWLEHGETPGSHDMIQRTHDALQDRLIPQRVGKREHITDGSMCWCNPDMTYKDPDNGAEVWVHKEPQ